MVVKGFPDTADEATLTSHFAACGEVVRVAWFVSMARGDHTIWICRCRFVYKCTVCVLLQLCLWISFAGRNLLVGDHDFFEDVPATIGDS